MHKWEGWTREQADAFFDEKHAASPEVDSDNEPIVQAKGNRYSKREKGTVEKKGTSSSKHALGHGEDYYGQTPKTL